MNEMIIVQVRPTELEQLVYVISNNSEIVPITIRCKQEELLSTVAMSAAKYEINEIKIQGAKDYTLGIKDQLTTKINTCFGVNNKINIELM